MRSSSALWAFPFVIALITLYYSVSTGPAVADVAFGYAPSVVGFALSPMYFFAYAVASGLAAWESGRLTRGGIWLLAPARSRFAVAALALWPVVAVAWTALLLPVGVALVQAGSIPTLPSLNPLFMALGVTLAHAVVGFAVGLRIRPTIAAPMMTVVVFVVVAFSVTTDPFWPRHILGQHSDVPMFGEITPFGALFPHLLLAGGLAVGAAALWAGRFSSAVRGAVACCVAVGCAVGAHSVVREWGPTAPISSGDVSMVCSGSAPQVCMPEVAAGDLPQIHREVASVVADLESAGIAPRPEIVTDTLADGRRPSPSTPSRWRLPLAESHQQGGLRYQVTVSSVDFPCRRPNPEATRPVLLWATERTGESELLWERLRSNPYVDEVETTRLKAAVGRVLALAPEEQLAWYQAGLAGSCTPSGT
ncbi:MULTISPECIES: hypothetical protein [unclassified Streptomyces]|uniref:DUF7224 domain-containing protein n=1 Tax=unclassified Streptomyces TaxID=2593676 RepID=UPI0011B015D7|nr:MULTISPECIES: hypothetical protein [unclassified Streptomyces]